MYATFTEIFFPQRRSNKIFLYCARINYTPLKKLELGKLELCLV